MKPLIHFLLEGQQFQAPTRWSPIGVQHPSEKSARKEEIKYRRWQSKFGANNTGWLDFRVVRVTISRKIVK